MNREYWLMTSHFSNRPESITTEAIAENPADFLADFSQDKYGLVIIDFAMPITKEQYERLQ